MSDTKKFDVFLCHNSQDKPQVEKIGIELQTKGLKPWLDKWELRPGFPWQPELERQIENINAAAVFIGNTGLGPWQDFEIQAFLRQFVKRKCPVIPVLLAKAPEKPKLPLFLEGNTWVDFRDYPSAPIDMLIWGVTGVKPLQKTIEHSALEKFSVRSQNKSTQSIQTLPVQPKPKPEVGYDYNKLEILLSQGNWKKADEETARCMLKISKLEQKGWLDEESINNFPCQQLNKIDKLWLKYSSHKFGFSVQKEIYQSVGGVGNAASNVDLQIWKLFGDKVGWRKGEKWLSYSDFVFNLETANEGHLPGWGGEDSGGLLGGGRRLFIGGVSLDHHYLMQKLFKCNI